MSRQMTVITPRAMMTVTIAVAAYGDAQTSLDLLVGADPHDVRWTVEGQRFALTVQ